MNSTNMSRRRLEAEMPMVREVDEEMSGGLKVGVNEATVEFRPLITYSAFQYEGFM